MKNRQLLGFAAVGCCALLLVTSQSARAVTYTGVGVYDESTTLLYANPTSNQVDTDAAPGVGVGTNLTVAQFSTMVLEAFNNNMGGVCDFEGPSISNDIDTSFDVTYGVAQDQTLTVNLTTINGDPPTNAFETGTGDASLPVSGVQYYGLSTGSDYGLTFSKPLVAFGLTALSRTANRTVNSLTITLDDDTAYVFGPEPIAPSTAAVNGPDDTFFGYMAPEGRTIVRVGIDASAAMRWDELGFIVGPESPPAQPGDFDSDGDVDGADFVAWQTNFPKDSGALLSEGDADGDGDVDGADFVVWQTNFPFTPSPGSTTPVPEPMSVVMLVFTSIGAAALIRKRSA